MKFKDIEGTYICQLNKPANRAMLEYYKQQRTKSPALWADFWRDLVAALINTPAWDVSGVNKMLMEAAGIMHAHLVGAKKNRISVYAFAGQLLYKIDSYKDQEAPKCFSPRTYKWPPVVTEEDLLALEVLT